MYLTARIGNGRMRFERRTVPFLRELHEVAIDVSNEVRPLENGTTSDARFRYGTVRNDA